jgi:hypothetical protein
MVHWKVLNVDVGDLGRVWFPENYASGHDFVSEIRNQAKIAKDRIARDVMHKL